MESEQKSDDSPEVFHNAGDRIIHVIRNLEKWVETHLYTCPKTEKIIKRWGGSNGSGGFVGKWEQEIAKNSIFQEEIAEQKRLIRKNARAGSQYCGTIFTQFGLHGNHLNLYYYPSKYPRQSGIDHLGETDFSNDELMSMKPAPGISDKSVILPSFDNSKCISFSERYFCS